MRRHVNTLIFALALAAAFAAPAVAGGNANFILGSRTMSSGDDWEPFESQVLFGANVDFGKEGWPIQMVAGVHASVDAETAFGVDLTATITELSFGVSKIWKVGKNTRPHIGGGAAMVTAALEAELGSFGSTSVDDSSPGFYVDGGVYWRLGRRFNIGVDARVMLGTDIEFYGIKGDANYTQIGLLLGWGWPAGK